MTVTIASRATAYFVFSLACVKVAGCGSDFTCADDRTCATVPDGASGKSGAGGGGTDAGSGGAAGGAGTGGAGTGGSAGSRDGSAGSAAASSGGSGGTGDAATDGNDAGDAGSCMTGTEGCACTSARECDSGLICRGTKCAKPVCGDSRIEGSEFCDDGQNLGAAVGDCAPDCTAIVVQKKIVISAGTVQPDFGKDGPPQFIANLDRNCPAGYKALFSDGVHRVATVTANVGNGQRDWPLHAWTRYVNSTGAPIWLTNATALLGFVNGAFVGLTNPISDPVSDIFVYTGMNADWTVLSSALSCTNWTSWNASAGRYRLGFSGETSLLFLQESIAT